MQTDDIVRQVAVLTRKHIERWAPKYDPSRLSIRQDLCGACGHASYVILNCLKRLGYSAKLVLGNYYQGSLGSHFWVLLDNEIIIDTTATQFFCDEKVVIKSLAQAEDERIYFAESFGRDAYKTYCLWADFCSQGKTPRAARQLEVIIKKIVNQLSNPS